jgi:hypothetical protein
MNILKEIFNCLGEESREVKITLYPDQEVCVELWERNLPLIISKNRDRCYLDTNMTEFEMTADMLEEVVRVMKVIDSNIIEIKNWTEI